MLLADAQSREVDFRNFQLLHVLHFHFVDNHAHGTGVVRDGVNQDEGSRTFVLFVWVEEERFVRGEDHAGNLVQLQCFRRRLLHGIDVHLVANLLDFHPRQVGGLLDEKAFFRVHALLVHPYEHCLEGARNHRQVVRMHQHFSPRDVNLVLQRQRDGLRRESIIQIPVGSDDGFHPRPLHGGQGNHLVAFAYDAGCHCAAEPTEVQVGAQDVLHRIAEILKVLVAPDVYRLQELQQRLARIPRHILRMFYHIVPFQRREGNAHNIRNVQRGSKLPVVLRNPAEHLFPVVHQIHFVHCQHHVLDAKQRDEERVAPRLRDNPHAGIHQNHRQVGSRAAGNHVARILLVSGGVGDDEFPPVG